MKQSISSLLHFLKKEQFTKIFAIVASLVLLSTVFITIFESKITIANALWWSFVTITTVGYGDFSPETFGGRLVAVVTMLLGIGVLGLFTATIASIFVERKMKEDRGMSSFDFEGHIIMCEWNQRANAIIQELRVDARRTETPIVLIANLENKPIDDPNLFFIKGNVTEDNLSRAKLANASTVLVLGDDTLDTGARDAKSVLTTLTIESMNPDAYTVVELDNEDNVKHCKRAKADEIVVGSEFSSRLISRAALDHGITIVISELLSSRIGNDLQKVPIPESLHNKRFGEVLLEMKNRNDSIAIAVQRSAGEVISNPPKDFVIAPDDFLIVISPDKRLAPA